MMYWKLPMIVRNSASGPSEGTTEITVNPDNIVGMIKHPTTGWASILIGGQSTVDTKASFDELWAALPEKQKLAFPTAEPLAPDPRDPPKQPAEKLESSHSHYHHS